MKKFTLLIICALLCTSFISCGRDDNITRNLPYYDENTTTSENLIATPEIMESTIIDKENIVKENKMIITYIYNICQGIIVVR